MKKIYLYIVVFLVVGVMAMPLVVKNQVNTQIETEKQTLISNGVELVILKEEGYISTIRDYELKIVDGKKFRDYIFAQLVKQNPYYKDLAILMKENSNKDIRAALDGTTFNGTIKNSNLLLEAPLIELSLVKFSDELMENLDKDKKVADVIKPILDEKIFTFFITLDENQNLSKVVMKDIDKTINENGEDINFKLKGHKLTLDIKDAIKGVYNIDTQSVTAKKFSMQTKGINYSFDYLAQFDNKALLHVDSFELKERKSTFKIGNIDIKSAIHEMNSDALNLDISYSIQDLYFKEQEIGKLDNFTLDLDLSKLNKEGVVAASDAYNKITFKTTNITKEDIKSLTDSLQSILNKGFNTDIKSSLSGLSINKKTIEKIDLILNAKLKENTFNLNDSAMINALVINGSITLNQNNVDDILKLDRSLKKFIKLGKKEADKLVFNYEFKQGSLFLNGTKL